MRHELELFLRNENVVNQNYAICEKYPYRFMRNGIWVNQHIVHLAVYVSGLSIRGLIENYENGEVETSLVFSTYGDFHLTLEEIKRREKIMYHLSKFGATYSYQ